MSSSSSSKLVVVNTAEAPQAIGPYSQAVRAGGFVYTAGAIPLSAAGEMVGGGDVRAQARQCLANLRAVLAAAGTSLGGVVKTTVFLKVPLCSLSDLDASFPRSCVLNTRPAQSPISLPLHDHNNNLN
jgi:reactive intermediate/imine deaminase